MALGAAPDVGPGTALNLSPVADPDDGTAAAIIDAALVEFARYGFRRVSMDDIARAAGVGRATVYRKFASKNGLIGALVHQESDRLLAHFRAAVAGAHGPDEHLVEGFVATILFLREHPLVGGLLERAPDAIISLVTTEGGPSLAFFRDFVASELRRAQHAGRLARFDAGPIAEIFVRVSFSILVLPASVIPLESPEDLRQAARRYFVPLLHQVADEAPGQD